MMMKTDFALEAVVDVGDRAKASAALEARRAHVLDLPKRWQQLWLNERRLQLGSRPRLQGRRVRRSWQVSPAVAASSQH